MSAAVCFIPATTNSNNQIMVRSQNNWEWQQHHSPPEDDEDDNNDYRDGEFTITITIHMGVSHPCQVVYTY